MPLPITLAQDGHRRGVGDSESGYRRRMSRSDANQLAFDVIRAVQDAAHPFTVNVGGTPVAVVVSRALAQPWPESGFDGVVALPALPAPVRVECTWPGGHVMLTIEHYRETWKHYRGAATLRVATSAHALVMVGLRATLQDVADGEVGSALAGISLIKRGMPEQAEVNRAMQKVVTSAGLSMKGRKVDLLQVRVPDGSIEGGAAAAFERAVRLALLKLDFVDRAGAKTRGTPLTDLGKLGLSSDALAALARLEDGTADEDDADTDDALARVRTRVERLVPDPAERQAALELLANAIENAHDERPGGWHVNDGSRRLWLVTGRLAACCINNGTVAMSVMGPISPEIRAALGAEEEENEAWKSILGGLYLRFPVSKAGLAWDLLKDPFDRFVDEAMARMRRRLDPDNHVPEAVDYVGASIGRALPQPDFSAPAPKESEEDDDDVTEETVATREPISRGRGPIFDKGHRSIISLVSDIEQGKIALPDLQRPFVWEDTKVRDLLDSLFVGYPTGTVVLWQTDDPRDARVLGSDGKATRASSLVIDGQQRLTSLYAVIKGAAVRDKDGDERQIRIAFRPRDGKFDVVDAAIAQNPEYLPDVSDLWRGKRTKPQIRKEMLAALRAAGREIDGTYEDAVEHNLERLKAIEEFEFPVVEIRKNEATDENVADIFVRINNQGTRLGQADFVLTLLSVYHGQLRDKIEHRAAEISKESVVQVDTQQLLRAACAVGFERARMSAIYKFLRGIDPNSGETSVPARQARLDKLDQAAGACLDKTSWRDYLLRVTHAGFVSPGLVASTSAVVNAFAFYVKGQQAGLEKHRLDQLIARWLFATLLTARYSTSSETAFEADLIRVRGLDGDGFVRALDDVLTTTITGDYWSRKLVADLGTQRSRAPSALAFRAAQIVLGARALFSDQLLQGFLGPGPSANRSAAEHHHLFPKAWLVKKGITDRREINQVANLADVGWTENSEIGASGPASYVPRLRDKLKLDDGRWGRMCAEHALPPGWEAMAYETFLQGRRQRMADIIRAAFRKLGGEEDTAPIAPPWFLPGAEVVWGQIVQTERALRAVVREVYGKKYGANAGAKIEAAVPEPSRETLTRALRSRPAGSDPLSVVDYLYLAQLPPLLFGGDVGADTKARLGGADDAKQRLNAAISNIAPVRNEIAHVREIAPERLQKASVACNDVLALTGKAP